MRQIPASRGVASLQGVLHPRPRQRSANPPAVGREGTLGTLSLIEDSVSFGERRVPYLFLVLEARSLSAPPLRIALDTLDEVAVGRGAERRHEIEVRAGARRLVLRVADPWLSSSHAS